MRSSALALAARLGLVLTLASACCAAGDVVHLTNGSRISGEVLSENEKEVVVRTPQGKMTLPRRMVDRIERLSGEATLLELAKERLAGGSREAGIALLEKAAKSKDPLVARKARARLRDLEAKESARARRKGRPRNDLSIPSELQGTPSEGATLQVQFDRLRYALDHRDGPRALGLLRSLRKHNPEHGLLHYLEGRAHELAREPKQAQASFLSSLGSDARRVRDRGPGWIKDLARRKAAGATLSRKRTPGAGGDWHRVAGKHAALFSLHDLDSRLAARFDLLADRAREAFDLRTRESDLDGRILVGLCVDRRELRRLGDPPPLRTVLADGVLWRHNCLARDLRAEAPLLVARAILDRAVPGTPEWAVIGASQRLQSASQRAADLARAQEVFEDAPPNLIAILEGSFETKDAAAERGVLAIVIDLIQARRQTLRRTLAFTSKVKRLGGGQKSLARFRIDQAELATDLEAALTP